MSTEIPHAHTKNHAFIDLNARLREGMALCNRRGMLKASLAGMAGLSLPQLLAKRAKAVAAGQAMSSRKSVILLWLAGGPSHLDTWDPKPTRPYENRGPFGVTQTALPGVHFCEHLPKQAAMADKFTVIRSVDCRMSNHEPNMVMQTGNREAGPRVNPQGHLYPAYGSIISKFRGANEPGLPPYVAFQRSRSHVAYGGYLGQKYDPFLAQQVTKLPIYDQIGNDTGQVGGAPLFTLASGLDSARIGSRRQLLQQIDQIRSHLDNAGFTVHVGSAVDPSVLTGDAAVNHMAWVSGNGAVDVVEAGGWDDMLSGAAWIVDALLGTGTRGEVRPPFDVAIDAINRTSDGSAGRVLSVDLPSGLDCDSGSRLGRCVRADHTATFVAPKRGLVEDGASEWVGAIHVVDIGIPRSLREEVLR